MHFSTILFIIQIFLTIGLSSHNEESRFKHKLIFQHIPKSGGVTVSSLLMNEYSYDEIHNNDSTTRKLYAYGNHLSLFEISHITDVSTFKLITFMRNPVARVLSEHSYCMRKHTGNPDILIAHRLPPFGDPIETASNVVCKMLSGLEDSPFIAIATHLNHAINALNNYFYFIGITEKMEESIQLLYSYLEWEPPEKIPHFNLTSNSNHFSNEVLQGITERNWADILLYEYALKLYEDKIKNQIKTENQLPHEIPNFDNNIHYTFDQPLRGYGWGIREISHNSNKILRWTTENNESAIEFPLQPDADYIIECIMFIQPIFASELSILVNGVPLSLTFNVYIYKKPMDYQWIKFKGNISKNLLENGKRQKIVFKISPNNFLYESQNYDNKQQNIMNNYIRGNFGCQRIRIKKSQDSIQ